ncbi:hypothetical protein J2W14_000763 [Pseudarthrobacter oxydans]|uniref:ferritin-like domain-containing protein n=1 Tax=Pseudarthrobacter oxydans TaxID=1671 RepID=UPI00277EA689|nr:ferritin-like domain-containing protein [Pseudarthrobacter oxydans]MDP9981383.1 hypothetical protein [Pseudarthrobacter oxydans]
MTTWSVVEDDSGEKQRWKLIPRIALLACLALVIVSLGIALSPGRPEEPAEPPFSEQARSAALAEAMRLRAAGEELGGSTSGDATPAVARTVSLLTSQARALLLPGQDEPDSILPAGPASPSDGPSTAPSAVPSAARSGAESGAATAAPLPSSAAALATALADSAAQRLADAAVADGGMARLLAAVGTAQLLQASSLAAAAGAPAPVVPDPAAPQLSGACPSAAASESSSPAGASATSAVSAAPAASAGPVASAGAEANAATLPGALAATFRTELETVYGYQVALTRLGGTAAARASEQLAQHEALAAGAETLSRVHCAPVPQREAGYTMEQDFLASPAAGLGGLEASALPVYGDLVALGEGQTRQWAIAGLVGAARRSAVWGAETGALPGLAADPAGFPELPSLSP